jgi:flagellar motor switch protein FliM
MSVKPIKWTNLRKMTGEEIRLTESIYNLLPDTSARNELGFEIRKMLYKHLGEKSYFYLDSVATETFNSFLGSIPEGALLATISVEPSATRFIVHIDNNLAFLLIDRLLGGNTEPSVENRPLSETEQGVLQYFLMQVLAQIWKTFGAAAKLHFRFERFYFDIRDIAKFANPKDNAVNLSFKVGLGDLAGFVKIIIPDSAVNKINPSILVQKSSFEYDYFIEKLHNYEYFRTPIWADGGRATISARELTMLEEGDVIIFDETGISFNDGKPSGEVDLKVGRGEEGFLKASITAEKNKLKCKIIGG